MTRRDDRDPPLSREAAPEAPGGWSELDIGYRNEDGLCYELVAVANVRAEKTGRVDATTAPADFILDRSL